MFIDWFGCCATLSQLAVAIQGQLDVGGLDRLGLMQLLDETRRIVQAAMESLPVGFMVPLKVDIHTGKTWAERKESKQLRTSQ